MKVLILAGGFGTRLSEETDLRPKPMVQIGGKPILWHIMKHYSAYGFNEFVILLGYKGYFIKEYFSNYFLHRSDVTFDLSTNAMNVHSTETEPWKVSLIDTGLNTMTGGRVLRAKNIIGNSTFLLTYGDGLSDVNLKELIDFHHANKYKLTLTAVQPEGRFGSLQLDGEIVRTFTEKPRGDGAWINGGFFVCEPEVLNYIDNDETVFEKKPLETIASEGLLGAFKHRGFWKPMDTLRDKQNLEEIWTRGQAPWKVWNDK